jgi:hypothetical protein
MINLPKFRLDNRDAAECCQIASKLGRARVCGRASANVRYALACRSSFTGSIFRLKYAQHSDKLKHIGHLLDLRPYKLGHYPKLGYRLTLDRRRLVAGLCWQVLAQIRLSKPRRHNGRCGSTEKSNHHTSNSNVSL